MYADSNPHVTGIKNEKGKDMERETNRMGGSR
jgi:hypothetical protein